MQGFLILVVIAIISYALMYYQNRSQEYEKLRKEYDKLLDRYNAFCRIDALLNCIETYNEVETIEDILQAIASRFEWRDVLKKERNEWHLYLNKYAKIEPERYIVFEEEDTKNDILEILRYAKMEIRR